MRAVPTQIWTSTTSSFLLDRAGFGRRAGKGSHVIFSKEGVEEIINIQPKAGKAKPYQVKQVRDIIHKYQLEID
ncbi:MAG TPA: type II toxin-antitoxin system HicA family toxin [Terrimicrobium sp.]